VAAAPSRLALSFQAARLEAEASQQDVVLEVLPHARQIEYRVDAELLEVNLWADCASKQVLGECQ
jgi:hypothetical protein